MKRRTSKYSLLVRLRKHNHLIAVAFPMTDKMTDMTDKMTDMINIMTDLTTPKTTPKTIPNLTQKNKTTTRDTTQTTTQTLGNNTTQENIKRQLICQETTTYLIRT